MTYDSSANRIRLTALVSCYQELALLHSEMMVSNQSRTFIIKQEIAAIEELLRRLK